MRARSWLAVGMLVAMAALAGLRLSSAAQAGVPVDAAVPAPAECLVAPRQLPLALATPEAAELTQEASPAADRRAGAPADEATVREITATVRESIACSNARDLLRELALFSDRFVAELLATNDVGPERVAEIAAVPPVPAPPEDWLGLVEIRDVRWLGDGRAGAIVVTANAAERYDDALSFTEVDGRWLIDEFRSPPSATPAAGT